MYFFDKISPQIIWNLGKETYSFEALQKKYQTLARTILFHSEGLNLTPHHVLPAIPPRYLLVEPGVRVFLTAVRCAAYIESLDPDDIAYFAANRFFLVCGLLGTLDNLLTPNEYRKSSKFLYSLYDLPVGCCQWLMMQAQRQTGKSTTVGLILFVAAVFQRRPCKQFGLVTSGTEGTTAAITDAIKHSRGVFQLYRKKHRLVFADMFGRGANIVAVHNNRRVGFTHDSVNWIDIVSMYGDIQAIKACAPSAGSLRSKGIRMFIYDEVAFAKENILNIVDGYKQIGRMTIRLSTPDEKTGMTSVYTNSIFRHRKLTSERSTSAYLIERVLVCPACLLTDEPQLCPHMDHLRIDSKMDKRMLVEEYDHAENKTDKLREFFGVTFTAGQPCFQAPELRTFTQICHHQESLLKIPHYNCIFLSIDPPSQVTSFFGMSAFMVYYTEGELRVVILGMFEQQTSEHDTDIFKETLWRNIKEFVDKLYDQQYNINDHRPLAPIFEIQNNGFIAENLLGDISEYCEQKNRPYINVFQGLTRNRQKGAMMLGTQTTRKLKLDWIGKLNVLITKKQISFYEECVCDIVRAANPTLQGGIDYLHTQLAGFHMDGDKLMDKMGSGDRNDLAMSLLFGISNAIQYTNE